MTINHRLKPVRMADAAVDGLIAGLEAGLLMVVFLIAMEWIRSGNGIGVTLMRFDPGADPVPLTGLVVHLAVSGVYGLLFGFLGWLLNHRAARLLEGWTALVTGGLFGTAIFLLPWLTFSAKIGQNFLGFSPLVFWLAHVLYGSTLAILVARMWSKVPEPNRAYKLS